MKYIIQKMAASIKRLFTHVATFLAMQAGSIW